MKLCKQRRFSIKFLEFPGIRSNAKFYNSSFHMYVLKSSKTHFCPPGWTGRSPHFRFIVTTCSPFGNQSTIISVIQTLSSSHGASSAKTGFFQQDSSAGPIVFPKWSFWIWHLKQRKLPSGESGASWSSLHNSPWQVCFDNPYSTPFSKVSLKNSVESPM